MPPISVRNPCDPSRLTKQYKFGFSNFKLGETADWLSRTARPGYAFLPGHLRGLLPTLRVSASFKRFSPFNVLQQLELSAGLDLNRLLPAENLLLPEPSSPSPILDGKVLLRW